MSARTFLLSTAAAQDTFIGPSVRTSISSNTAPEGGPGSTNRVAGVTGVEEEKGQGVGGPRERERARAEGSEGRSGNHGDEGGGNAINDSGASFRRFVDWGGDSLSLSCPLSVGNFVVSGREGLPCRQDKRTGGYLAPPRCCRRKKL